MFKPVNRHILIDIKKTTGEAQVPIIVLPDDYSPEESRFVEVTAIASAEDARIKVQEGEKLIVDRSMIDEISIGPTIYNVILDNYVVGIIE